MVKTAITPTRQTNFAEWYQQVIKAADLAEHAVTRGCMVIKPYGYAIWELIQQQLDQSFKQQGIQNAYFPLLIPASFLTKEAEQVEGFAKECAVVTHHRLKANEQGELIPDGELEEPYIIRPTSETIIGSTVSKWIQSYRDLPLKLNQWCNVMRWEMRTRLFLRTAEFLWQEGHTFFQTADEAQQDAQNIWNIYYNFLWHSLALACVKGEKTPEEKFPGATNTYTIEALMQDNKALQACTSHYLGQTFAKAFNINYLDKDGDNKLVYSCSWGLTTRIIGGIIMSHADDNGLVLPPAISPHQIVIIPIIQQEEDRTDITTYCQQISDFLSAKQLRTFIDLRDRNNPDKIWEWIKKGVPIRLEIGKQELEKQQITFVRRDQENIKNKQSLPMAQIAELANLLQQITSNLQEKSTIKLQENIVEIPDLVSLEQLCQQTTVKQALMPRIITETPEFIALKEKYSLSRRCIPETYLHLPLAQQKVLVGKAY